MATPKGMRGVRLPVNGTDAVHVYSDDRRIWLQLRRKVPTESGIGKPSFKAALCLTPGTARKLGLELLKIAERNNGNIKAKNPPAAKQTPTKTKQSTAASTSK
jgi:hypothetical protein